MSNDILHRSIMPVLDWQIYILNGIFQWLMNKLGPLCDSIEAEKKRGWSLVVPLKGHIADHVACHCLNECKAPCNHDITTVDWVTPCVYYITERMSKESHDFIPVWHFHLISKKIHHLKTVYMSHEISFENCQNIQFIFIDIFGISLQKNWSRWLLPTWKDFCFTVRWVLPICRRLRTGCWRTLTTNTSLL